MVTLKYIVSNVDGVCRPSILNDKVSPLYKFSEKNSFGISIVLGAFVGEVEAA